MEKIKQDWQPSACLDKYSTPHYQYKPSFLPDSNHGAQ